MHQSTESILAVLGAMALFGVTAKDYRGSGADHDELIHIKDEMKVLKGRVDNISFAKTLGR
jgi:hypothetical protein